MRSKVIGYLLFVVAVAGMAVSCSIGGLTTDASMPSSIGFDVPDHMRETKPAGDTGVAYELLKGYVEAGAMMAEGIDMVLSAVYQNSELFMLSKGNKVSGDAGEWFYFDEQSEGYYLYYGDADAVTNFYIDWVEVGEGFSGKVVWMETDSPDYEEVTIYYDTSLAEPYMDIYAKPTAGNSDNLTQLRVKLIEVEDGKVQALAQSYADFADSTHWMDGWDILGYGEQGANGGAICSTIGSTNGNFIGGTDPEIGTNYVYQEYFNSTGETTWRIGNFDLLEIDDTMTNIYDIEDSSGSFGGTYTNAGAVKPAAIETVLSGMTPLSDSAYPSVTLP